MSLFGDLAEKAVSSVMGSSTNPIVHSAYEMIQNHPGGLDGLVTTFQQKGLGDVVSSWVSSGQNLPISADQISHVLGSDAVKTPPKREFLPIRQDHSWLRCYRVSSTS